MIYLKINCIPQAITRPGEGVILELVDIINDCTFKLKIVKTPYIMYKYKCRSTENSVVYNHLSHSGVPDSDRI